MKTIIPLTLLAAFAATNPLVANTTYSKPSGYVTQTLSQGFNLVGLTLHNAPIATGTIDSAAGNVLTDAQGAFAPVAGKTYLLELTSGSLSGVVQVIPSANITATTLTTTDDISANSVNQSYILRIAPTIEEILPLNSGILTRGPTSNTADIIWVPRATPGSFNQYYIRQTPQGVVTLRTVVGNELASNVPLPYTSAIFIQRKATGTVDLVTTGQVKTSSSIRVLKRGFNLIATTYPVGSTIQNSGLVDSIGRGTTAAASDIIWIPTTPGNFAQYYVRQTPQGVVTLRTVVGNEQVNNPVNLTPGVFIEQKGAIDRSIVQTPPATYSNL